MATDFSVEVVAAKISNSRDSTGTNHEKVSSPPHDVVEESSDVCKRKREELARRTLNPFHDTDEEEIQNNNNNNNTMEQNTTMHDHAPFDEQDENFKDEDDHSGVKEEENSEDDDDDKEDDEKSVDFHERQFFSAPSFTPEEMAKVEPCIREMIAGPFQNLEANGYEIFTKYLQAREQKKDRHSKAQLEKIQRALQDATICGDPREYQSALFEIAKAKNTIVNLGTGFGKTLIALLCIRHFSPDFDQGKQTLFLVPSVALAIQQSATLRANLPGFSVQTACYASSNSDASRRALGKANVIVATHGAVSEKGLECVYGPKDMQPHTLFKLSPTDP
jgi:primosomal protein N'